MRKSQEARGAMPPEAKASDAAILDQFRAALVSRAIIPPEPMRTGDGRIPTTRVYRYGPGCVRDNKDLKDAVALLAEHGRARLEIEGRRRFVVVNPALYAG